MSSGERSRHDSLEGYRYGVAVGIDSYAVHKVSFFRCVYTCRSSRDVFCVPFRNSILYVDTCERRWPWR